MVRQEYVSSSPLCADPARRGRVDQQLCVDDSVIHESAGCLNVAFGVQLSTDGQSEAVGAAPMVG